MYVCIMMSTLTKVFHTKPSSVSTYLWELKVAARHSLTSANILLVGGEDPRLLL